MHAWENALGRQFAAKLKTTRPQNKFAKRSKRKLTVTNSSLCTRPGLPCLACLRCLLSFAQFLLGSKSNALRQRRSQRSRAKFPYKFNAPTGKAMSERDGERERGRESMCVSELMPDNKQNIKTALSARRIMQADPSTTSQSQSMLATPSPLLKGVTLHNPYKIS